MDRILASLTRAPQPVRGMIAVRGIAVPRLRWFRVQYLDLGGSDVWARLVVDKVGNLVRDLLMKDLGVAMR